MNYQKVHREAFRDLVTRRLAIERLQILQFQPHVGSRLHLASRTLARHWYLRIIVCTLYMSKTKSPSIKAIVVEQSLHCAILLCFVFYTPLLVLHSLIALFILP